MVLHAQPADKAAKEAESATLTVAPPAAFPSTGTSRNPFPPIADYAFLSDCETTCLISPAGSVEWLCVPRPDSPSVFGAILDRSAGHFRLGPYGVSVPSARRYLPGSLIMETTWQTHTGWLIVRDALVMGPWHDIERRSRTHRRTPMDWDAEHILLRTIRCVSGTIELLMSCEPAFDYHRISAAWEYSADGYGEAIAVAHKDPDTNPALRLTTNLRIGLEGSEARARTRMKEGDDAFVALSWSKHPAPQTFEEAADKMWNDRRVLAAVDQYRQLPRPPVAGLSATQRTHPERLDVFAHRRALGCQHHLASRNATGRTELGLPLCLGARLDVRAVGAVHPGARPRSRRLLLVHRRRVWRQQRRKPPLQVMYGVGGERRLVEEELPHLSGYDHARPVRIGNGAYNQDQHDIWGAILDSFYLHAKSREQVPGILWPVLKKQVEEAIKHWREPDRGIWEVRGEPQHFTSSKMMCWVAADRGAKLAERKVRSDYAQQWRTIAEEIKADILDHGVNSRGVFTQRYGSDALDASLLQVVLTRFLPSDDPRVRTTVLAIADELTEQGLVLRYRVEATDDGLIGEEGTFTICSFWLVSALVEIGEVSRADICVSGCCRSLARCSSTPRRSSRPPAGIWATSRRPSPIWR